MLVMTRECGEKLLIGANVVLTIVSIDGDKIRVGIDAPRLVTVDRQEAYARHLAENGCEGESNHCPLELAGTESAQNW